MSLKMLNGKNYKDICNYCVNSRPCGGLKYIKMVNSKNYKDICNYSDFKYKAIFVAKIDFFAKSADCKN